ncbi:unnamed protein product [Calicophoron daubneyi]|uniref:Alpha/beta hydrolase fold-3 domain-containing protein n=1 Tax=Calicophoron daubneyi TaxID=300641 RepID=A0AAV2T2L9_CALDB
MLPPIKQDVDYLYENTNWMIRPHFDPIEARKSLMHSLKQQSEDCCTRAGNSADYAIPYDQSDEDPSHGMEAFDWFPPEKSSTDGVIKVVVYIHGGFWRAITLAECSHWATSVTSAGGVFVALSYRLAPWQSISMMPQQLCKAMQKIYEHTVRRMSSEGNQTPRLALSLVGHSAGAHLSVELIAAAGDAKENQCWLQSLDSLVLISGLYDLRPIIYTSVNQALKLQSEEEAWAVSPCRFFSQGSSNTSPYWDSVRWLVGWTEHDSPAFKEQSEKMVSALTAYFQRRTDTGKRNRGPVETFCCPNEDHFTSVQNLYYGKERSALLGKILEFVGLSD